MRQVSYSVEVFAPFDTLWLLLVERVAEADGFPPGTREATILERHDNVVVRELRGEGLTIRERVTIDRQAREIRYDLMEHPLFSGYVLFRAIPRSVQSPVAPINLTMVVDWVPKSGEAEKTVVSNMPAAIQEEVLNLKAAAEEAARE
jgi:hypothetical protein